MNCRSPWGQQLKLQKAQLSFSFQVIRQQWRYSFSAIPGGDWTWGHTSHSLRPCTTSLALRTPEWVGGGRRGQWPSFLCFVFLKLRSRQHAHTHTHTALLVWRLGHLHPCAHTTHVWHCVISLYFVILCVKHEGSGKILPEGHGRAWEEYSLSLLGGLLQEAAAAEGTSITFCKSPG